MGSGKLALAMKWTLGLARAYDNNWWELEWRNRNLPSWSGDYESPTQPTPSPPDGTAPGTLLPGGLATIPLNRDWFTNYVLARLNTHEFRRNECLGSEILNDSGLTPFYADPKSGRFQSAAIQ